MKYPAVNDPALTHIAPCMYCGQAVAYHRGYEQVVGFRQRRAQGGPNQVTVPTATGRWACPDCIDRLRAGINPLQRTLVP